MGRSKDQNDELSPSLSTRTNDLIRNKSITESKKPTKSKSSPSMNIKPERIIGTRSTICEQSLPPKRSLYDDNDSESGDQDTIIAKTLVGISNKDRGFETHDDSVVRKAKKMKMTDENIDLIPDNIGSGQGNYQLIQGDKIVEYQPLASSSHQNLMMKSMHDDGELPGNFKALLINTIRTTVFRRIKFLTNEKLGLESSVFQLLFRTAGLYNKLDQHVKYESVRTLVQRQMNSKRNYCTDQIMAKARELLKADKMFDFNEIEHFYRDEYFDSGNTRKAWYLYCYKFLTCVNGDWLKSVNPSNARNQVHMFRYVTVSDEAFVRWVLEVKKVKLFDEKLHGWPVASGGKKPNGMHDSRQFSLRYAEIHSEVKKRRSDNNSHQWNNLFWSIYRLVQPKFFVDPTFLISESLSGTMKVHIPDEDDYEPENQRVDTIIIFNQEDEDKSKYLDDLKFTIV